MPTTLATFIGLFDRAFATASTCCKRPRLTLADAGLAAKDILDWKLVPARAVGH